MPYLVAIIRYNRQLHFGLAADPDAIGDFEQLAEMTEKTAAETISQATQAGTEPLGIP